MGEPERKCGTRERLHLFLSARQRCIPRYNLNNDSKSDFNSDTSRHQVTRTTVSRPKSKLGLGKVHVPAMESRVLARNISESSHKQDVGLKLTTLIKSKYSKMSLYAARIGELRGGGRPLE
jgi:hypothetical protein